MIQKIIDHLYQFFFKLAYRLCRCLWFIFRPRTYGVNIAVWYNQKILLVKPSYKNEFSLPGGYIKYGENKMAAAVRELNEELSLEVEYHHLVFFKTYTSSQEYKKDTTHVYEITLSVPPSFKVDNREIVWAEFVSPKRALDLNISSYLRDYIGNQSIEKF